MRTSQFTVRLVATTTFSTTSDVTAQGATEAKTLAEAALREALVDLPRPVFAESYDVEVEAIDVQEERSSQ